MPEERIDHTNDTVERHPSLLLNPKRCWLPGSSYRRRNARADASRANAALQHLPDHEY